MTGYTIALFVHLCALFAAFGGTALTWLALKRLRSARVCGEALQWLGLLKSSARVFPVAILALVLSGAYMVSQTWSWSTPWVDAGLAAVVYLGIVGDRVEGGRVRRIAGLLMAEPGAPFEGAAAAAVRDPVLWSATLTNPLVALGAAFVMVTKPDAAVAGGVLAAAVALGCALAVPLWRTAAPGAATAAAAD